MSQVQEMLNSRPLYMAVILGLIFVVIFCIASFRNAWNRARELNMDEDKLKGIIKSSVLFTIVPSIAIVIALFSLASVLGVPWSWFRLSVVGSISYELMASEMAVTGAGYSSLAQFIASDDIEIVSTVMMVMSISILGGIVFNFFFGKKIQSQMLDFQAKDSKWGTLALSYFSLSMATVFLPIILSQGPVHFATIVTSSIIAVIHVILINKYNWTWLSEFLMANVLILGMISSVFWHNLLT